MQEEQTTEVNNDNDHNSPRWDHKSWVYEAIERFGNNHDKWTFVCPQCETASSLGDFKALGFNPQRATSECIGRVDNDRGCDWAAFGLIRGPVLVVTDDDNKEPVAAFRFAEPAV